MACDLYPVPGNVQRVTCGLATCTLYHVTCSAEADVPALGEEGGRFPVEGLHARIVVHGKNEWPPRQVYAPRDPSDVLAALSTTMADGCQGQPAYQLLVCYLGLLGSLVEPGKYCRFCRSQHGN